jgi:type IV pilus assembly protein PilN|tara:strand:- start:7372 stop:9114 length:1743 start_codon:yes stop_codon:yes gene_type:complete
MKLNLNPIPWIANTVVGFLSKYSVQQEEIVGLDITPKSLRLVQLSKKGKEWMVEKLSYRHIEGISDIKNDGKRIAEEIQIALKAGKFSTTNGAISLPVSNSIVRVIPIPLMTEEEMQKSIDTASLWENITQLPDALENYSIFYQIIKKDPAANMMDVLFVASKITDVNVYVDVVTKGGINPVILDVRCFALRNALETAEMSQFKKKPLAILEIGEFENFLLIIKNENPYVSDIFASAKDKETLGKAQITKETLSPIIDRYVMQIKQNLVTYINRFKVDKIENLFIVTQSPHIKEIIEALSLKLKDIKISIFDPFNKLKLPAQITDKLKGEDNKSSFTASVGLATRKLDIFGYYKKVTGVQNINLLPNREVVKKTQRTKLVSGIFVTIIIVMILSFSGYYGYSFWNSLSENEVELKEYDVTKAKVEEKQLKLFVLKNKVEKLNKEISLSDTATTNQHTASAVLEEILKVMGNPYLLSIDLNSMNFDGNNSYEIKGVAVMSQIVKNSTKKNISADKTVIEYISRLKKNPIFSNASLVKSFLDPEQPEVCLNKNCTIKTEKKNFIFKLTVKKDLMNLTTLDKK